MRRCGVILAGGSGTRLWPLSRRNRPKQLIRLFEGRSLLYRAFERLRALFEPQDIYVVALADHLRAIAEELPTLPPENLIGEPQGRDTANAIALAAAILHRRDPETIMGVFTADHVIRPTQRFAETIRRGFEAVDRDPSVLACFGIKPTFPHTGLGYVRHGPAVSEGVVRVASFKEKPDAAAAAAYLESGGYSWNSGMFVWRTGTILEALRRGLAPTAAAVERIAAHWPGDEAARTAAEVYPTLERISIDYAVMEDASNALMVEMDVEWLDVGSWEALSAVVGVDGSGNTRATGDAVVIDGTNNVLVAEDDHLIALLGVDDVVVVHSEDATLVCRRDQAERIKELVALLQREHGGRRL